MQYSRADAHGQVILKYFNKEHNFDVVEREDGFVNVDEGAKLYFSKYGEWDKSERQAIRHAHGRCLDIGCGAGRVLLYLQQKGLDCVGIDYSPLAIKVCKLRGVKNAKVMGIDDVTSFRKGAFDTIIMYGNNFGLFGNKNKAKRLLKTLHTITSDNATIIAEDRDPYITDNPVHFKYHASNVKRGRMPGQLKIRVRFMQYSTPWYDYLYVSKDEMKELLNGTGWRVSKFINSEGFRKNGVYVAIIKKM